MLQFNTMKTIQTYNETSGWSNCDCVFGLYCNDECNATVGHKLSRYFYTEKASAGTLGDMTLCANNVAQNGPAILLYDVSSCDRSAVSLLE